jgi:hypothetical protein
VLGVKTIGNATLIAFDGRPVLVTDPWLGGEDDAYFGSWTLTHAIPKEEHREILDAEYVWFSHGHPDHLNPHSKKHFLSKKILLPDHVGDRIKDDLERLGYDITVLPDRKWITLSKRVKILCISDYIQDAVLLVDVNGRLFVNLNDSAARGHIKFIQKIIATYKDSYLLKLSGWGDADMINLHDEDGIRIEPPQDKTPGLTLSRYAEMLGTNHVIPFSAFHRYQRSDSVWANAYVTPMQEFETGFLHDKTVYIDAFAFIDCVDGAVSYIDPPEITPGNAIDPAVFGDNWNDELTSADVQRLTDYFVSMERLHHHFGFFNFRVGNRDNLIKMNGPQGRGITFEVPRNSLMTAIEYRFFDDLLIGNFMKTTLHGVASLYDPPFSIPVAKYADNGNAITDAEVKKYLNEYRSRAGFSLVKEMLEERTAKLLRRYAGIDSSVYGFARSSYFWLKSR